MAQFVPGEVLTAANLNNSINAPTINEQTASAYTLVLADAGKVVLLSGSAAQTVTIPAAATASFTTGTTIGVLSGGNASVTIQGASLVTLNSTVGSGSAVSLTGAYTAAQLFKSASNTWIAIGSID
jgi:hypothetical protein